MSGYVIFRCLLAAAVLLSASNARSENISFDYVQASYISDTVDPGASIDAVDGNGIGFSLSLGFAPAFAMLLEVQATTFKTFQGRRVDTSKTTTLGMVAHTSVATGTDIFANLSVVKAEVSTDEGATSVSDSDFGGVIDIGLRHMLTDAFEVELVASHMKVFARGINSYAVDTRYYFRKKVSVGIGYTAIADLESLLINVRASF